MRLGRKGLLKRNFHLSVTAGCGGVHGSRDFVEMPPNQPPRRIAKNDRSDFPARKILLIAHVLVSRKEHVKTGLFSGRQQSAIG